MHEDNCFITLTFSDKELLKRENPLSVDTRDFQKFMKRLRKYTGKKVRYFHCGEYGDENMRPHYHACLFGLDFEDKYVWMERNGNKLYRSPTLEKIWPFGYSSIGEVNFETAAYVARYVMKKVTGEGKDRLKVKECDGELVELKHYQMLDKDTGEIIELKPEYTTMSRRPGIGKD